MRPREAIEADQAMSRRNPLHKLADGTYKGHAEVSYAINRLLDDVEPLLAALAAAEARAEQAEQDRQRYYEAAILDDELRRAADAKRDALQAEVVRRQAEAERVMANYERETDLYLRERDDERARADAAVQAVERVKAIAEHWPDGNERVSDYAAARGQCKRAILAALSPPTTEDGAR